MVFVIYISCIFFIITHHIPAVLAHSPVNQHATTLTRNLFYNLRSAAREGRTMIGMDQGSTKGEFQRQSPCGAVKHDVIDGNQSDIRSVCNQNAGIHGFDFLLMFAEWVHQEPFNVRLSRKEKLHHQRTQQDLARTHIQLIHRRGGVSTLHWHMNNPSHNNATAELLYKYGPRKLWQMVPPGVCRRHGLLKSLTDCGLKFHSFKRKFRRAIKFMNSLLNDNGNPIPIILRPLHEQNGDWFWWGGGKLKGEDFLRWQVSYRAVWSWMVKHHNKHGVNNVLWASSPNSDLLTRETYLKYLPSLKYVDVLGFDAYGDFGRNYPQQELDIIVRIAEEYGKIPAFTEVGYNDGDRNEWPREVWTKHTLGPALNMRIAWALMWFNSPEDGSCNGQYWGPHRNHPNEFDFLKICARDDVLMEGEHDYFADPMPRQKNLSRPRDQSPWCAQPVTKMCEANNGRGYGEISVCGDGHFCAFRSLDSNCKCRVSENALASNTIPYCIWNQGCGFGDTWDCGDGIHKCAKSGKSHKTTCVSFCDSEIDTCSLRTHSVLMERNDMCTRVQTASNGIPFCTSNDGCGYGDKWECGDNLYCAKTDKKFKIICVSSCRNSCAQPPYHCEQHNRRGNGPLVPCEVDHSQICAEDEDRCECTVHENPIAENGFPYCMTNNGCGFGIKWQCGPGLKCAKTDTTFKHICVSEC